jgi:ATP-dependent RNA helicase RhlE
MNTQDINKSFEELKLLPTILRAVREKGYSTPTPIQARAIPPLLDGRDLLGVAQTGTGKTAAFALPILDYLLYDPRPRRPRQPSVLVLAPTRELAAQIGASFETYGKHGDVRHAVIFGGVGQSPQVRALEKGIDILVATPGRLSDLIGQGHIDLSRIEVFVLDEADRMLDMGFIHDVRRTIALLPKERQNILLSATMPPDIQKLAQGLLKNPVRVEVTPPATTVEKIEQSLYRIAKTSKRALLTQVLRDDSIERVLVFSRTKRGADRIAKHLNRAGLMAESIHGDKSQGARERALERFRSGEARILIATDIAARGIDVPGITHVLNFDLPNTPESYVHRIGRTARAGRDGAAISFCDPSEEEYLTAIEKRIRRKISVRKTPELAATPAAPQRPTAQTQRSPGRSSSASKRSGGRRKPQRGRLQAAAASAR